MNCGTNCPHQTLNRMLRKITDDVARLTGLCAGTPVSGGCLISRPLPLPRGLTVSIRWRSSPAPSINEYVTDHPVIDKDLFMTSIYPIEGKWLITEASPTSASNPSGLLTTLWRAIGKPPPNKDRRSMTCVISWFHQRRRMKATCCSFRSCLALTPFPMPRPALSVSTASIKSPFSAGDL